MPRYTVEAPSNAGTYYQTYGWRLVDATPDHPDFRVFATGTRASMRRYAAALNAR